jgi:magnesium transporter
MDPTFPERPAPRGETAARLAVQAVPRARMDEAAETVLARLRIGRFALTDLVAAEDENGRFAGIVETGAMLRADPAATIAPLVRRDWPRVLPATDQEHAVEAARSGHASAVAVVADDGTFAGLIPAPVLLDVLVAEHHEDMHRIVGILRERDGARHALEDAPARRVARRLPWLLVGLALSSGAAAVMAYFEDTLRANVMIAFFIPSLVYLTDAIGTQTEAIAVRGLSLRRRRLSALLLGEAVTGAMIGLALGVIAFLGIWLAFGEPRIGFGVGISLFIAGSLASSIGLFLPWVLSRLGVDPAFGSGPVATIVQDVLTIAVYFAVMTRL